MNSSVDSGSSIKYAIMNSASILVCLLAAILVFAFQLHKKLVYRLALYQVLAALMLALVQLLEVIEYRYMYAIDPDLYRLCIALGWFNMYSQWVKLLFTIWVTFHLFCFGVLHKNLKKLELLYVVTSLLVPAVIAVVPLTTHSYGYSSVDVCYIPAYAAGNNETLRNAIIERFALWHAPAMVILLALSIMMAVMVVKLAHKVCWRLKHDPTTGGDQFQKALKQLLPLAAFPVLFFLFIIPVFIYNIYYSFITPTPSYNLTIAFIFLWSMTSGLVLIVHITVA